MSNKGPFPRPRLLAALAQARIARLYSPEALDNDPEIQRLRAEGHDVLALPGVTIIIEKYKETAAEVAAPGPTEGPIK